MEGSRMFIDPTMQVPVEDLLKGMIVQSGNDATMALAEGVGGTKTQFVAMMNAQAKALGMNATSYKNPEGLTEAGHITTARDLSLLATRLMQDFPSFVGYYAIQKYRYPGTPAANDTNRNLLLFRDPTVDGLKTGHTDAAGYCLVATAKRDFPNLPARRLLAIVLGASSEHARAGQCATQRNARRQRLDDVPAHRTALVVRAQAGQAGECNHGHAGGDGDFDARVRSHAALGQDHGHKGRNQHAPADAQQTGHESGAKPQGCEFSNQLRLKHGIGWGWGLGTRRAEREKCLRRPPDRHPKPQFRWARSAPHRVHLTRDDRARGAMFQALAQ
jgi:hypothetical protein